VLKAFISLSFGLSLISTAASAVDWAVKGTLGEAVELSDNQFLKTTLAGWSLGSYSTVETNLEGSTPRSKFDFDSNAAYKKYWGPGIDGLQSEYLNYGFKARYEQTGKTSSDVSYIEASYSQQSAALALFNALAVPSNASGFLNQASVRGGLERALSNQDTASLWVRSIFTNYDPSNAGIAFMDTLALGDWKHQLNSEIAATAHSEVEYLSYQNLFNSSVLIVRDQGGVDAKISPRLSIRGTAGSAYVQTNNGFGAAFIPGSRGISGSAKVVDFVADMLIKYSLLKTTTLIFNASRSIGPSIVGSLLTQTNARAGVEYEINSRAGLSFYADFTRLVSPATTDIAIATVQYSQQLTRTWSSTVSYRYIHRFTATGNALFDPITGLPTNIGLGPADSNSILIVLSKSFVLLPHGT
jgi:hypothetical protein